MVKLNLRKLINLDNLTATESSSRLYIQGVYVAGDKLVATDGVTLGVYADSNQESDAPFIFNVRKFLAHNKPAIKAVNKFLSRFQPVYLMENESGNLYLTGENGVNLADCVGDLSLYTIDGTFPQWDRVFPSYANMQSIDARNVQPFNPQMLKQFKWTSIVKIVMNNTGSPYVVLTKDPEFLGLIMPTMDKINPEDNPLFMQYIKKESI